MGKVYSVDVACELPTKEKRTFTNVVMNENLLDDYDNKARVIALIYDRKTKKYFDNFSKVKIKIIKFREIKGILEGF
jgi:hypothetical protein